MANGVALKIDPNVLTVGDMEDFEEYVGLPFDKAIRQEFVLTEDGEKIFDDKGRPETQVRVPAKALVALVWITGRHGDPNFSLADARSVRVTEISLGEGAEADQGN